MGSTNFFNFTKFGSEGRLSDQNYKFSNRDRETIDSFFWTLLNHDHRVTSSSILTGPTQVPVTTLVTTGGVLPAGVAYYYKISFRDTSGNETEASTTAAQSTPDTIAAPPTSSISTATTGGSLDPGVYRYALSYYQTAGGETRATNIASITVPTGTSTNTITLTLATKPADADGWKVYRKAPTETEFYYLTQISGSPTDWTDTGAVSPDCTKSRPTRNDTNAINKITIDIDSNDLPLDTRVVAWRIYRSTTAGIFGANSLLATVVETTTEGGTDLITTYDDTGGSTVSGSPLSTSVVPPPIPQLDASDVFDTTGGRLTPVLAPAGVHVHNTFCAGTLAVQDYNQFYATFDMPIERIDCFYQTAPTGVDGSNYVTLRVSDDGVQNDIQSVHTTSETTAEVQSVSNNATSGTFTLSDTTDTTSAIDYDGAASVIKTRLETDITAIIEVTVTGTGTPSDPWIIVWVNPGATDFITLVADDAGLTGGTSTVTVLTEGSDGGTFTLSDGTDTTNDIAFDAATATVETRLETDITAYVDVTVTGTGTPADPWLVEFVDPGSQAVDLMVIDDSSLNGTGYVSSDTRGYGNTVIDVDMTSTDQYHFWQSTTTDYGEQEAEDAPATGGTPVSDQFATNDVAMELDTQNETNEWAIGTGLNTGDYVARFYAADTDATATYEIRVVDQDGGDTTIASLIVSDGSTYLPAKELYFTDTGGTEDWRVEIEKTDAGAGVVRIDKYEYEAVLPTLHAESTVTVEALVTGSPTTNGDDLAVTIRY